MRSAALHPLHKQTGYLDNFAGTHGDLFHQVSTPEVVRHKVVQTGNGSAAKSLQRGKG